MDSTAIDETIELLLAGKIVAIKGVGGFHLSVDATNEAAVTRLQGAQAQVWEAAGGDGEGFGGGAGGL